MISDAPSFDRLAAFGADVRVIGGGPVGVVTALEFSKHGARVLLPESGGTGPSRAAQSLSAHENLRPRTHHDHEIVVARLLKDASSLLGGRCLPFDPVDFAPCAWPESPA